MDDAVLCGIVRDCAVLYSIVYSIGHKIQSKVTLRDKRLALLGRKIRQCESNESDERCNEDFCSRSGSTINDQSSTIS